MASATATFHWADYVVFCLFLVLFSAIGVFHGFRDRKKQSARHFLTGGGKLHFAPVALSMMASFLSAIFVLSIPAEMYVSGSGYAWLALSYFIGYPIAAHVYLPIFYRLGVTSGYEYLELRFNKVARVIGCLIFITTMLLYMAVVMYTPSLALSQVTGIPLMPSILGIGVVVTFYTAVGGMKATVWNDAIQMVTIFIGFILLIALGAAEVGGLGNVFSLAWKHNRIQAELDPNPFIRTSVWTHIVGGTFFDITLYAGSQLVIQKFISTSSVREGQKAVWVSSVTTAIQMMLVMTIGMVMFAYYETCDPLAAGAVAKKDQVIPLFVMHVMGHLHGLPGLFVATAFSGTLSTVSGGVNALAAVTLEDIVKPLYRRFAKTEIEASKGTALTRISAVLFGALTIAMAFFTEYMGTLVVQIAVSIFGMIGAPLTGLITLGMLFESANVWGGLIGLAVSVVTLCWIGVGAVLFRVPQGELVTRTDGCGGPNASWYHLPAADFTMQTNISVLQQASNHFDVGPTSESFTVLSSGAKVADEPLLIFSLSYMHYCLLGILIVVLVGLPVSFLTGGNKERSRQDDRLFFHFKDLCSNFQPETLELEIIARNDDLKVEDVVIKESTTKLNGKDLKANGREPGCDVALLPLNAASLEATPAYPEGRGDS